MLDPHLQPIARFDCCIAAGENYLPDGMSPPGWYRPTPRGMESRIADKLAHLRALDREAMQRSREVERGQPKSSQQNARQSPSGGSASREDPARKSTPGEESLNAGGDDPS